MLKAINVVCNWITKRFYSYLMQAMYEINAAALTKTQKLKQFISSLDVAQFNPLSCQNRIKRLRQQVRMLYMWCEESKIHEV